MTRMKRGCLTLLVPVAALTWGVPSHAMLSQTAQHCGAKQDAKPTKVFADSNGQGWHEYPDIKSVPELELNGALLLCYGQVTTEIYWLPYKSQVKISLTPTIVLIRRATLSS